MTTPFSIVLGRLGFVGVEQASAPEPAQHSQFDRMPYRHRAHGAHRVPCNANTRRQRRSSVATARASSMLRGVSFDALVVLGCRVGGELSPAAMRRVERTALAYRDQGARFVIVCGGKLWHGIMEADAFTRGLAERGVPEALLLQERESLTTRGNAGGARRILRERSLDSIGLVTCDWHMPRALYLFRLLGLSPTPLPAASPARPLHVRGARFLRERASLALDLATSPLWFRA